MLYDPKWEAKTRPDVFSLAGLISWLEKQPADGEYRYSCNGECLLAQYFTACGFKQVSVGGFYFRHAPKTDVQIDLPPHFNEIAVSSPSTFGAALKRARAAAR